MNRWIAALVLVVALAGGCVSNTNPVLKPEQLIVDLALDGNWVSTGDAHPGTADVHPAGADKRSEVVFTTGGDDADGKKQRETSMLLGKIKDLEVVEFELKPQDRDHASQAPYVWAIIRHADAKSVTADMMDAGWLKKYVADHPNELATKADPDGNSIIITASTDDFQKFLLAHAKDDGAFSEARWVRPAPATQPAAGG